MYVCMFYIFLITNQNWFCYCGPGESLGFRDLGYESKDPGPELYTRLCQAFEPVEDVGSRVPIYLQGTVIKV